jgi:RimJ/RimL family protein N-acetyltransferase
MLERETSSAPVLLGVDNETYLRRFVVNDAPMVVAAVQEHAGYIGRTEPWAHTIGDYPDKVSAMRVVGLLDEDEPGEPYGLFYRSQLVGGIALHSFSANHAKLGYWRIDTPEVRGKGLVTRAARRVAHMGFTQLGLAAISIEMTGDNTASRHVAERLGGSFMARTADGRLLYVLVDSGE